MTTPTYKTQFDKLTRAYIENRVNPNIGCACFVGNLLNGVSYWENGRELNADYRSPYVRIEPVLRTLYCDMPNPIITAVKEEAAGLYSTSEILRIEEVFLNTYYRNGGTVRDDYIHEAALFMAFEETLDLLKEIHISKGEVIDEVPVFKKRKLQTI